MSAYRSMKQHLADSMNNVSDAIGVTVGKVGQYGGGASALIFGLSASEFAAVVAAVAGAIVAVAGYLTQLHFNRRRDAREQAEYEARMELRRRGVANVE